MSAASVEVSGRDAERLARELQGALSAHAGSSDTVSPVEVARSADLVVAVIGLVFSGVGPAKALWDWWRSRSGSDVTIRILMDDGAQIDLSAIDEARLQIEFERRT